MNNLLARLTFAALTPLLPISICCGVSALAVPSSAFPAVDAPPSATDLRSRAEAVSAPIRGTFRTPGLHRPVHVQRDRWGVAHIYARDTHDLFFAQGLVAAQDRLFQMELWKRSGQGRLAEVLGPSALARDIQARRLTYRGNAAAEYSSYAPDGRAILRAFTDGINAYIKTLQGPGHGLPLEFQLLGFAPEPWRPEDCLNRLAAFSMMSNATAELRHAQTVALLGAEQATALYEFDPRAQLVPAPESDFTGLTPALLSDITSSDRRIPIPASLLHESNNWVIAGSMAAAGKPILANDPHRVIAQPSLRYIVHLVAPGWDVIGAGEPGLPGVAVGHNDQIAWGFTIFGIDQQDLYLERLDPKRPGYYQTPSGWSRFVERSETIGVRNGTPVSVTLRFTRHGPVLWQDDRRALALRWVGSEPGAAGYLGSLSLDRARNWRDFEAAMPRWKVPSENIVYADRSGNIGEHSTGLTPRRHNFNGLLPVPGEGTYEWDGFLDNATLPHRFNPADRFIATANHKMIPDDMAYPVGFEWAPSMRFDRITQVLQQARDSGRRLEISDMEALQSDVLSLSAQRLQSMLQSAIDAPSVSPDEAAREPVSLLLRWDCQLRVDSAAALLYELWVRELTKATMDRLVALPARPFIAPWSTSQVIDALANMSEGRGTLLLSALTVANDRAHSLQGDDSTQWRWGALHKVYFRNVLDTLSGAATLFDRGPVERSGDGDVVQATALDDNTFEQIAGASYREIFDLSDWDSAVAINVPGQSGQPGSPHYDDLLPLWQNGQYFPLKYSRPAVDAVTTDVLDLVP